MEIVSADLKLRHSNKWKSRFCSLKKPSPIATCLNIHVCKNSRLKKKTYEVKPVIVLQDYFGSEAGFSLDREQNTLAIICADVTVVLSFSTQEQLLEWEKQLKRHLGNGCMYHVGLKQAPPGFVLPKTDGQPLALRLHVHDGHFCLVYDHPPKVLGQWKFEHLRRYGPLHNTYCFDVGTRAGKGAGFYMLLLSQNEQLHTAFSLAARDLLNAELIQLGIRRPRFTTQDVRPNDSNPSLCSSSSGSRSHSQLRFSLSQSDYSSNYSERHPLLSSNSMLSSNTSFSLGNCSHYYTNEVYENSNSSHNNNNNSISNPNPCCGSEDSSNIPVFFDKDCDSKITDGLCAPTGDSNYRPTGSCSSFPPYLEVCEGVGGEGNCIPQISHQNQTTFQMHSQSPQQQPVFQPVYVAACSCTCVCCRKWQQQARDYMNQAFIDSLEYYYNIDSIVYELRRAKCCDHVCSASSTAQGSSSLASAASVTPAVLIRPHYTLMQPGAMYMTRDPASPANSSLLFATTGCELSSHPKRLPSQQVLQQHAMDNGCSHHALPPQHEPPPPYAPRPSPVRNVTEMSKSSSTQPQYHLCQNCGQQYYATSEFRPSLNRRERMCSDSSPPPDPTSTTARLYSHNEINSSKMQQRNSGTSNHSSYSTTESIGSSSCNSADTGIHVEMEVLSVTTTPHKTPSKAAAESPKPSSLLIMPPKSPEPRIALDSVAEMSNTSSQHQKDQQQSIIEDESDVSAAATNADDRLSRSSSVGSANDEFHRNIHFGPFKAFNFLSNRESPKPTLPPPVPPVNYLKQPPDSAGLNQQKPDSTGGLPTHSLHIAARRCLNETTQRHLSDVYNRPVAGSFSVYDESSEPESPLAFVDPLLAAAQATASAPPTPSSTTSADSFATGGRRNRFYAGRHSGSLPPGCSLPPEKRVAEFVLDSKGGRHDGIYAMNSSMASSRADFCSPGSACFKMGDAFDAGNFNRRPSWPLSAIPSMCPSNLPSSSKTPQPHRQSRCIFQFPDVDLDAKLNYLEIGQLVGESSFCGGSSSEPTSPPFSAASEMQGGRTPLLTPRTPSATAASSVTYAQIDPVATVAASWVRRDRKQQQKDYNVLRSSESRGCVRSSSALNLAILPGHAAGATLNDAAAVAASPAGASSTLSRAKRLRQRLQAAVGGEKSRKGSLVRRTSMTNLNSDTRTANNM